jgi:ribosomal protein S18 acetylase RimI-like enzyme
MYIERLNPDLPISEDDVQRINEMLKLLNSEAPTICLRRIMTVARANTVLLARDDTDRVVGMTVLVVITKMLSTEGRVEEVIRHDSARGQHVGRLLMEDVHERAQAMGCSRIELTSHPTRARANQLYRSLGYIQRETNVFRREL